MSYTSYRNMGRAIAERRAFTGNRATGRHEGGVYKVYSYSTLILELQDSADPLYFDNSQHSRTTSRLQGIIIRALDIPQTVQRKVYEAGGRVST
jgi:hypothetical protein